MLTVFLRSNDIETFHRSSPVWQTSRGCKQDAISIEFSLYD